MLRNNKLDIFENFTTSRPNSIGGGFLVMGGNGVTSSSTLINTFPMVRFPDSQSEPELVTGPLPWYKKVGRWTGSLFGRKETVMTVQQFFGSVKDSVKETKLIEEKARGYELAIAEAKENGQVALMEKLEAGLVVARAEAQLTAVGYTKYITEETLVSFVKQCEKGLRLDWLQNFTRPLPPFVAKRKLEAHQRAIFDNYVVLHYDPSGKSYAETKEEIEKKKDPILFGVVKGSRRLYFIADWIDELCDLTLEDIAEKMGKQSIQDIRKEPHV
jgi:hypothetical protein